MVELSTPVKVWFRWNLDCNRRVAGSIPVRFILFALLVFMLRTGTGSQLAVFSFPRGRSGH